MTRNGAVMSAYETKCPHYDPSLWLHEIESRLYDTEMWLYEIESVL